jgi:hypothetical protein
MVQRTFVTAKPFFEQAFVGGGQDVLRRCHNFRRAVPHQPPHCLVHHPSRLPVPRFHRRHLHARQHGDELLTTRRLRRQRRSRFDPVYFLDEKQGGYEFLLQHDGLLANDASTNTTRVERDRASLSYRAGQGYQRRFPSNAETDHESTRELPDESSRTTTATIRSTHNTTAMSMMWT